MRRNQRDQLGPGHHLVHLVKKLALARPLGLALESHCPQAQRFYVATASNQAVLAAVLQAFLKSKTEVAGLRSIKRAGCCEQQHECIDSLARKSNSSAIGQFFLDNGFLFDTNITNRYN